MSTEQPSKISPSHHFPYQNGNNEIETPKNKNVRNCWEIVQKRFNAENQLLNKRISAKKSQQSQIPPQKI